MRQVPDRLRRRRCATLSSPREPWLKEPLDLPVSRTLRRRLSPAPPASQSSSTARLCSEAYDPSNAGIISSAGRAVHLSTATARDSSARPPHKGSGVVYSDTAAAGDSLKRTVAARHHLIRQGGWEDIVTANQLAVRLVAQLHPSPTMTAADPAATDPPQPVVVPGVSVVEVVDELQQFASLIRSVDDRARRLNGFVLFLERDPYRDVRAHPDALYEKFQLPAELTKHLRRSTARSFEQEMTTKTYVPSSANSARFLIAGIGGGVGRLCHRCVLLVPRRVAAGLHQDEDRCHPPTDGAGCRRQGVAANPNPSRYPLR